MVTPMIAEWTALAVGVLAVVGEYFHGRRCRRIAHLAFGPKAQPRAWVQITPALRVLAVSLLAWGFVQLYVLAPKVARPALMPDGGFRHLIIALDVSPSMQLKDGGEKKQQTRAQRAAEVLLSILQRIALDQTRVSVIAFYTDAKPVVVDTFDIEVVKNILSDLPLQMAFDTGKTSLISGVREAAAIAKPWKPGSTTLIIASDGDTVPDTGMPEMPRSIAQVLVLGVGARSGQNIDGHLSRQDSSALSQLATRLRGTYQDVNEKHIPSKELAALAAALPMRDQNNKGKRELALAAVVVGASLLAVLPVFLALAGAAWRGGVRTSFAKQHSPAASNHSTSNPAGNSDKPTQTYA